MVRTITHGDVREGQNEHTHVVRTITHGDVREGQNTALTSEQSTRTWSEQELPAPATVLSPASKNFQKK